jgi:hypothetical protein
MINNADLRKKADVELQSANKCFSKKCCSRPEYELAVVSFKHAYIYYKALGETGYIIDITDKIIICNENIGNTIGITLQYEDFLSYMCRKFPDGYIGIYDYFDK